MFLILEKILFWDLSGFLFRFPYPDQRSNPSTGKGERLGGDEPRPVPWAGESRIRYSISKLTAAPP